MSLSNDWEDCNSVSLNQVQLWTADTSVGLASPIYHTCGMMLSDVNSLESWRPTDVLRVILQSMKAFLCLVMSLNYHVILDKSPATEGFC